jgi:hypothetical protein
LFVDSREVLRLILNLQSQFIFVQKNSRAEQTLNIRILNILKVHDIDGLSSLTRLRKFIRNLIIFSFVSILALSQMLTCENSIILIINLILPKLALKPFSVNSALCLLDN